MATNSSDSVGSELGVAMVGLRGGFATTRPVALYVGAVVAVIWDVVAFVHLFHFSFIGASLGFWWPWAWLLMATIAVGWSNRDGRVIPWWLWVLFGIGILAVAGAAMDTGLSIWAALAIAVWPRRGHPWWVALGVLALIHALAQWGLLMTQWHLSIAITMDILWVTGLGMLVSARGSNWRSA